MDDSPPSSWFSPFINFWRNLPVPARAMLVFSLSFIVVDAFNYFSAGTALVFSLQVLCLGCGALAVR